MKKSSGDVHGRLRDGNEPSYRRRQRASGAASGDRHASRVTAGFARRVHAMRAGPWCCSLHRRAQRAVRDARPAAQSGSLAAFVLAATAQRVRRLVGARDTQLLA
ncbi:MAG: hypothetical protein AMXMBFR59_23940 [Rhodanobacteraceae bacterium]